MLQKKSSHWAEVPIGEILKYRDEQVVFDDMTEYTTITVKRRHGGLEAREKLFGHEIKTKKQYRLHPGAFIISRVQCWHAAFAIVPDDIPENMIASQNYDQFEISPKVDNRFFWWLSHSPQFIETVRSSASGVVIEKLVFNRDAWLEKTIPIPPLDEQQRIVERVEAFATRIAMVQSLRNEADRETDALIEAELNSIIQDLEKKYETKYLEELLMEANYGTSVKCFPEREKDAIPVLRIPNVVSEKITLSDLKFGVLSKTEFDKTVLKRGDILVVRTNGSAELVGRCAVVNELPEPMAFASYMIRIRCKQEVVSSAFLQLVLRQQRTSGLLFDFARTSAGQYNVSLGRLYKTKIPVPPLDEQRRIVAYLDSVQARLASLRQLQSATAEELSALLPSVLDRAFKGEL